jgi:O-antigen/teichoic acid export membrane protein
LSTIRSFFKESVFYGLASVLPRVINFLLVRLYTGVFNTAEFSSQTRWYVYAAFFNVILTLGLETAFFRFYNTEKDKHAVIFTSFIILTASSFFFLIIGFSFSSQLANVFGFEDVRFIKILVSTIALDTLAVIPFALLRVHGKSVKFMVLKVLNVLALAVAVIFLLLLVPELVAGYSSIPAWAGIDTDYSPGVIHIFIANLFASLLTLALLLPEIVRMGGQFSRAIASRLLSYGWPVMIGGIAYALNENLDKLIIPYFMGEDANGVYAACYKLGVFMTLYITAFRMGAEPFFFNHAGTSNAKEKYSFIMTWFVIFGSFCMLLVMAFLDPVADLFLRQKAYLEGLYIVPLILLANLFSGIYNNLAIWYKLTDKTRFGMYISIFGGAVTVISLLLFIPVLGITGAALATLFTYATMAAISYLLGRRHYPVPYEISRILLYIFLSAAISATMFLWLRGNYIVCSMLIILYAAFIAYTEQNNIKRIIRGLSN